MKERKKMGRVNEGGSVVGFVIIGVILAGLLIGGAYFVTTRSAQQPAPSLQQQPQGQKPQEEEQTPAPAEPGNQQPESTQTPESTPQTGMTHELPATGPEDTLVSLIALGLLAGISAGYVRSRQARFSL
ncbi:MAG TPA: LPXTG cell wall anchor domain-containing protein [Candidatus Saccharimonadales bacterium]|nr:LPXTG cell wall anchor domain-containing protein [Candidatus Saccharimonadales bacterium]